MASWLIRSSPLPFIGIARPSPPRITQPPAKLFQTPKAGTRVVVFPARGWLPVGVTTATSVVNEKSFVSCTKKRGVNETSPKPELKVYKQPEKSGNNFFHVYLMGNGPKVAVRFPTQQLQPKLSMSRVEDATSGQKEYRWRASYDFQHVPAGEFVDLIVEYHSHGQSLQRGDNGTALVFPIHADTSELTAWIMMPEGKEYQSFHITRYETGKPETVENVNVVTEYLAEEFAIIAFKLLSLKSGYTYEVSWTYR